MFDPARVAIENQLLDLRSDHLKTFGERLCAARRTAGLSRNQAVKLLSKPDAWRGVLVAYESGSLKIKAQELTALCALYHIQWRWLFAEPRTYRTVEDAFQAVLEEEITDSEFMQWMLIDRICQQTEVQHE